MKLLYLTWVNMKRLVKNYQVLLMIVFFPAVLVGFIFYSNMSEEEIQKQYIAVYDRDNTETSRKLIEDLKEDFNVNTFIEVDENEVYGKVREGKEKEVYQIDKGFEGSILKGEKPKVKIVTTEESPSALINGDKINLLIEEILTGKSEGSPISTVIEVSKAENHFRLQFMILMICYFIIIGGGVIAEDLMKLKSQNIIKRSITTANRDIEILAGIFLAIFILQSVGTSLVLLILFNILSIKAVMIPQVVLAVVLCSAISTSVILAATRWVKTSTAAELTIVIYGLLTYLLAVSSINVELMGGEVPVAIEALSKLSPFYWLNNIITNTDLIVSIVVILIMAGCFLTAGSLKLRDFAKE